MQRAGDQTLIGDRGVNLSGGQKARLGLARALYQDKEIYLMDDPTSALDAHVRAQIIENVYFGALKDRTRILVTHAIDFLERADHIVLMDDGQIVRQGSYGEMLAEPTFAKLVEINQLNKEAAGKGDSSDDDVAPGPSDEVAESEDIKYPSNLSTLQKLRTCAEYQTIAPMDAEEMATPNGRVAELVDDSDDDNPEKKPETIQMDTIWRIANYNKNAIWLFAVIVALQFTKNTLQVKQGYLFRVWGKKKELQTDMDKMTGHVQKVVFFVLAKTGSGILEDFAKLYLQRGLVTAIRADLLRSIMSAPVNLFFDIVPTATIHTKYNGDVQIVSGVTDQVLSLCSQLIGLGTTCLLIAQTDPWILLIIAGFAVYVYTIQKFAMGSYPELMRAKERFS